MKYDTVDLYKITLYSCHVFLYCNQRNILHIFYKKNVHSTDTNSGKQWKTVVVLHHNDLYWPILPLVLNEYYRYSQVSHIIKLTSRN